MEYRPTEIRDDVEIKTWILNSLMAAMECRPTEIRDDVMKGKEIVVVGDYVMEA